MTPCPICYDDIENLPNIDKFITECDHIFCLKCIREWLEQSKPDKLCPLCKQEINLTNQLEIDYDSMNNDIALKNRLPVELNDGNCIDFLQTILANNYPKSLKKFFKLICDEYFDYDALLVDFNDPTMMLDIINMNESLTNNFIAALNRYNLPAEHVRTMICSTRQIDFLKRTNYNFSQCHSINNVEAFKHLVKETEYHEDFIDQDGANIYFYVNNLDLLKYINDNYYVPIQDVDNNRHNILYHHVEYYLEHKLMYGFWKHIDKIEWFFAKLHSSIGKVDYQQHTFIWLYKEHEIEYEHVMTHFLFYFDLIQKYQIKSDRIYQLLIEMLFILLKHMESHKQNLAIELLFQKIYRFLKTNSDCNLFSLEYKVICYDLIKMSVKYKASSYLYDYYLDYLK